MENLIPAEIKLDIFSRLPAVSVLQCRQVCKTWRTLLHHPDFAHMHLYRTQQLDDHSYNNHSNDSAAKLSFLLLIGSKDESDHSYQLCYHEYDEDDERSYKKPLTRINHPLVKSYHKLVGSCNGLIYFYLEADNNPIHICNPITREYVILPSSNISRAHILHGFGYLPSTNEYKVVRISLHCNGSEPSEWYNDDEVDAQVYTLGSGSGWRKIKSSSLPKCYLLQPWGVLANGALYWLGNEGKSVSFDLVDEELRYLQSPTYEVDDHESYLHVWGGMLYFVHRQEFGGIDIWSFKNNKKSSTTTNDTKEQAYQSWSWSMEFNIALEPYFYEPFALTKSGDVLMAYRKKYNQTILSCYDLKTGTLKKLDTDFVYSRAIPHVNSFVSLKAIGEDAKIIEPAEGLAELEKLQFYWYH